MFKPYYKHQFAELTPSFKEKCPFYHNVFFICQFSFLYLPKDWLPGLMLVGIGVVSVVIGNKNVFVIDN